MDIIYRLAPLEYIVNSTANRNHGTARRVLMNKYFRLAEATVHSFIIYSHALIHLINIYSASARY